MKKFFLYLLLVLGLALTQSSSPPFGVRLSALPATTSSPSLSVTGEVVELPAGVPVTVRLEARYVDPATGKTVSRSQSGRTVYIPPQAAPRILRAYWIYHDTGSLIQEHVENMRYAPNGFRAGLVMGLRNEREGEPDRLKIVDPGPYAGWDVLINDNYAPYTHYTNSKFLHLELNRSATLCLIGTPSFVQDSESPFYPWKQGGAVRMTAPYNSSQVIDATTWCRVFAAGAYDLPPPSGMDYVYSILLAEADGTPARYPQAPTGMEQPRPNQYCPTWLAERYRVQVQGISYPTWRPQVDPVYWCYFGNEHGSDPGYLPQVRALLQSGSLQIPFGIVEDAGNVTPLCVSCHQQKLGKSVVKSDTAGFKVFVNTAPNADPSSTIRRVIWVAVFQLSSSTRARLCQQHHEYHLYPIDADSGELLASLRFAADTGVALDASAQDDPSTPRNEANETHYRPDLCPENWHPTLDGEGGRRRIPEIGRSGYETWQPVYPPALGFTGSRAYNVDNPMTRCSSERDAEGRPTCSQMLRSPSTYDQGDRRWFILPQGDAPGLVGGLRLSTSPLAPQGGTFYTDVTGTRLLSPDDPGAVRQWINPKLRDNPIQQKDQFRWIPGDPFYAQYRPTPSGLVGFETGNIEGALRAPN